MDNFFNGWHIYSKQHGNEDGLVLVKSRNMFSQKDYDAIVSGIYFEYLC